MLREIFNDRERSWFMVLVLPRFSAKPAELLSDTMIRRMSVPMPSPEPVVQMSPRTDFQAGEPSSVSHTPAAMAEPAAVQFHREVSSIKTDGQPSGAVGIEIIKEIVGEEFSEASLRRHENIHRDLAWELVEKNFAEEVVENLDKFSGLTPQDRKELAWALIHRGDALFVADNMEKFFGLTPQDYRELLWVLIDHDCGMFVPFCLESCSGLTPQEHKKLAWALVDKDRDCCGVAISCLRKFYGLTLQDRKELAWAVIHKGWEDHIASSLEEFSGLMPQELRELILALIGKDPDRDRMVAGKLDEFFNLTPQERQEFEQQTWIAHQRTHL